MPDVIVTTPKNRMAEAALEAEEIKAVGGGYYYREFKYRVAPAAIGEGDRVYYVEDGYIRGFCLVSRVAKNYMLRFMTVFMDPTSWKWIKPLPWKAPRSFQYAPAYLHDKVEIVGGWLDPRPEVDA
ncbi:MAG: hypothetical protein PVH29_06130 [Candidatus Zixiibacteriota bacterium]|jgi:hypothetical protein